MQPLQPLQLLELRLNNLCPPLQPLQLLEERSNNLLPPQQPLQLLEERSNNLCPPLQPLQLDFSTTTAPLQPLQLLCPPSSTTSALPLRATNNTTLYISHTPMKTRNLLTPSTDSEQTHSGPAKRLNSRSSPFLQVTKQPTRLNFPTVKFQQWFAG